MDQRDRDRELQYLTTRPGTVGSGAVRYAAAMYFHKAGKLGQHTLEIYRTLAKDDDTDPLRVARAAGASQDIEQLIAERT